MSGPLGSDTGFDRTWAEIKAEIRTERPEPFMDRRGTRDPLRQQRSTHKHEIHAWNPRHRVRMTDAQKLAWEQKRRLSLLQQGHMRRLAVEEHSRNGRLAMIWDLVARYKDQNYLLELDNHKKVIGVHAVGDIVQVSNVDARLLNNASSMPVKLKRHLQAAVGGEPTLFWNLLVIFLDAKEPELKIGRKIRTINPRMIEYSWVVWFDDKTAVEFEDERSSLRTDIFHQDFGLLRTAKALSGAEILAKIEYYVLSSLAGGVKSGAEAAVSTGGRVAYRQVVKFSTRKIWRRTAIWVVENVKKSVASAVTKSVFAAGGEFIKTMETERRKLILQKGGNPASSTALTQQELEGLGAQAFTAAVTKFVTSLISKSVAASTGRFVDSKLDSKADNAVAKALVKMEQEGFGARFRASFAKNLSKEMAPALAVGAGTIFVKCVGAGFGAASRTGQWDGKAYGEEFRNTFATELVGLMGTTLQTIPDTALSATTDEIFAGLQGL